MQITNYFATRRPAAIAANVFFLCALLASVFIWQSEKARIESERNYVAELASEHAHAIRVHIDESLSSAYALAALIRLGQGKLAEFQSSAEVLLTYYPGVAAVQLAPDGVIARIVPLTGNEKAIGHNLLTDPARDKEAFLARDTGKLTLAGPFPLVQGGQGAAGRLPVYLDDGKGNQRFWGFVVVLLRFPESLKTGRLTQLTERGYDYELSRVHPDTGKKHVIAASSKATLINPVQRTLQTPNAMWTLSVAPTGGWNDLRMLGLKVILGLLISLGFSYCARYLTRDW